MTPFYGTKKILATPMTRQAYNDYRGWKLPADEDGSDEGFLVEYVDGGQANHPDHEGYISWSPRAVFDGAYQATDRMNFGHALQAMREGQRVARKAWQFGGSFVYLVPPASYPAQRGAAKRWAGDDAMIPYGPYLAISNDDGEVSPFTPGQDSLLAEDWYVLPEDQR